MAVNGLHHISMIVHHPQKTIDFYQGILKLKLIKQTVNFDDPYTYHLYFGNKNQAIGSLVTFFPWLGGKKGKLGDGQVYRIQFKIPKGALPYWEHRFNENQVNVKSLTDTNHKGILFYDPDNIAYELIETNTQSKSLDIIGFHGIKLYSAMPYKTKDTLINLLDFTLLSQENTHIHLENNAYHITIKYSNQTSAYGVGSVHHVAFSLENDELMGDVIDKLKRSIHHPTSV
ncbi:MAG: VOC family protein, partial [Candidatus Izemoplasmataceae bacterium]